MVNIEGIGADGVVASASLITQMAQESIDGFSPRRGDRLVHLPIVATPVANRRQARPSEASEAQNTQPDPSRRSTIPICSAL